MTRKRFSAILLVVLLATSLLWLLPSCAKTEPQSVESDTPASERAGDSALPELDGAYVYVLAKSIEKNPETNSIEIEVCSWENDAPFYKSGLPAGETGTVSCEELVFFPAGIGEGSIVVISCLEAESGTFPLVARSIEALNLFNERVERWTVSADT